MDKAGSQNKGNTMQRNLEILVLVFWALSVSAQPACGDDAVQITSGPGWELEPDWSPDGTRVAYRYEGDIWITAIDGGTPTQLTTHESSDQDPSWSPDGSLIAFDSERSGAHDIWVIPSSGGMPVQLTDGVVGAPPAEISPAWSPDGDQIVFSGLVSPGVFGLWAVPSAGGEPWEIPTGLDQTMMPDV